MESKLLWSKVKNRMQRKTLQKSYKDYIYIHKVASSKYNQNNIAASWKCYFFFFILAYVKSCTTNGCVSTWVHPTIFSRVHVAQFLVFCVVFSGSLYLLFVFFHLVIRIVCPTLNFSCILKMLVMSFNMVNIPAFSVIHTFLLRKSIHLASRS
jgi:hypothetical protein